MSDYDSRAKKLALSYVQGCVESKFDFFDAMFDVSDSDIVDEIARAAAAEAACSADYYWGDDADLILAAKAAAEEMLTKRQ